jgi:hypothetical protein
MGSKSKSVDDNISTGMMCFNRAYNNRACSAAAARLSFLFFYRHLYFVTHAIRRSGDRRCSKALKENRKLFAFDYIWAATICKVMRLNLIGQHSRSHRGRIVKYLWYILYSCIPINEYKISEKKQLLGFYCQEEITNGHEKRKSTH